MSRFFRLVVDQDQLTDAMFDFVTDPHPSRNDRPIVEELSDINPDLVDTDTLNAEFPNFPEYTIANIGAAHTAYFFTSPGSVYWATKSGTWGESRDSTPEKGEEYLQICVRSTLAVLENIENTFKNMPVRE